MPHYDDDDRTGATEQCTFCSGVKIVGTKLILPTKQYEKLGREQWSGWLRLDNQWGSFSQGVTLLLPCFYSLFQSVHSTQVNQSNKLEEKTQWCGCWYQQRITPWYQGTLLADSNTDAKGVSLLLYYWLISMSLIPDIKESKKIEKTPPTYLLISHNLFFCIPCLNSTEPCILSYPFILIFQKVLFQFNLKSGYVGKSKIILNFL